MCVTHVQPVTVRKLDLHGNETWRYKAEVLERGDAHIKLQAQFDREDMSFHGLQLKRGDRFVEIFYSQHWFNIFAVHDHEDNHFKGWYCNIGYPAEISENTVSYRDLALDLLVFPDGRQMVLDQDEFARLPLSQVERQNACLALRELQESFQAGRMDHLDGFPR